MPAAVSALRFPPPWTVDENGACFIVKEHGQALAKTSVCTQWYSLWTWNFLARIIALVEALPQSAQDPHNLGPFECPQFAGGERNSLCL